MFDFTVYTGTDPLDIGLPYTPGLVMGMTDIVPMHRMLSANLTTIRHFLDPPRCHDIRCYGNIGSGELQGGETLEKRTEYGTLAVHDDVLGAIVQSAALSVPGVVDLGVFRFTEGLGDIIKKDIVARGITLEDTDKGLVIEVAVIVEYGARIPALARMIVQRCSDALAEAVSVRPRRIMVEVQGVVAVAAKPSAGKG